MKKLFVKKNTPDIWARQLPWPRPENHKYSRGYAVINGGDWGWTGAAKIAAYCALRAGAGAVSVACTVKSLPIYGASFQAIMTSPVENKAEFSALIKDERISAVLLGPGNGITMRTKSFVLETLRQKKPSVLDADALTVFSRNQDVLFKAIKSPCIITPHEGEFSRLFGGISGVASNRQQQARFAASKSGAIVILKGFNTIIAAPDGRIALNFNATPFLATAGAGDALAGICTGLLAQGMPAFEAACAAVWIHARVASDFGPGLIAEDIADLLPACFAALYEMSQPEKRNSV